MKNANRMAMTSLADSFCGLACSDTRRVRVRTIGDDNAASRRLTLVLSAIGVDQDCDGGRGVRLISDARRPESPFAGRVSRRRAGAQLDFGGLGRLPTWWDDQTQSSEALRRKTSRQNPRLCRSVDTGWGCQPPILPELIQPSSLKNVNLDKLHLICPSIDRVCLVHFPPFTTMPSRPPRTKTRWMRRSLVPVGGVLNPSNRWGSRAWASMSRK